MLNVFAYPGYKRNIIQFLALNNFVNMYLSQYVYSEKAQKFENFVLTLLNKCQN